MSLFMEVILCLFLITSLQFFDILSSVNLKAYYLQSLKLLQHVLFKTIVSIVGYTGRSIGIKEENIRLSIYT